MPNISAIVKAATKWRSNQAKQGLKTYSESGVVCIAFNRGKYAAYAWKNCLRDPQCEMTGTFAVELDGSIYEAVGGNDYDGAQAYVPVSLSNSNYDLVNASSRVLAIS